MKFLVDESTGIKVSQYLKEVGHDSISVSEKFLGFPDKEVLREAEKSKRIVVTNDKYFGDMIFYHKLNSQGVILLRLKDESVANKIRVLEAVLSMFGTKIKGNFVTATDEKIRIRKLG